MPQQIPFLTWAATVIDTGPVAVYTVNFTVDVVMQFTALHGSFGGVDVRPKFVTIDNFFNDQIIRVSFGAILFPVSAFQRLTLPVPTTAVFMQVQASGGASPTDVIFAVNDLSRSDGINFKGIQSSIAVGGALKPVDPLGNGNINIVSTDLAHIKNFLITAASTENLPLTTDASIGNGFNVETFNRTTSTANVTIATSGGEFLNDGSGPVATYTFTPGMKGGVVSDGNGTWWVYLYGGGGGATFISAIQAIVAAGALTIAHGLGVKPDKLTCILVCVVNDAANNFVAGDEVVWQTFDNIVLAAGFSLWWDAVNINVRFSSSAQVFVIADKVSGNTAVITLADWRIKFVVSL